MADVRSFGIYPAYLFKDHDPILDRLDTLYELTGTKLTRVAELSRVSIGTLINWRSRRTKRPQFSTVAAVVRAIGGTIEIRYRDRLIETREGKVPKRGKSKNAGNQNGQLQARKRQANKSNVNQNAKSTKPASIRKRKA